MPIPFHPPPASPSPHRFRGLAPFLRRSIAGDDMLALAQGLLSAAQSSPDDANLLMDLSIAMFCINRPDLGHAIQKEALTLSQHYALPARRPPAHLRLLMLMAPGDLAANTPLECLLEDCDIDLDLFYLSPEHPSLADLPPHDALFVAVGEFDRNLPLLAWLDKALTNWPRPVLNAPGAIPQLARHLASQLLQGIPGLLTPATHRVSRNIIQQLADGEQDLATIESDCRFPVILRPVGSQAGQDLARIAGPVDLSAYLGQVDAADFFLANFIDYSSADRLFRKARVVLVNGKPFIAHMAVSAHWMVHYVNAGMYEEATKRTEEANFMADFPSFAERHRVAFQAIWQHTGLDYLCLDCAETQAGELLIFEAGNAMVVHAMDSNELFPYKPKYIAKTLQAFREMLTLRTSMPAAGTTN